MTKPTKFQLSKSLLKELDSIDKKHESGKITKKQHDTQSKRAVDKVLKKL